MKKFFAFVLVHILLGSITIPVIHAHCMDEVSIDGSFLCCYDTDDGNSCDKHTPVDTTNDEILSNTFSPTEKVKKNAPKIFLSHFEVSKNERLHTVVWQVYTWWNKYIPPILWQKLRAHTKEIKKRE